MRVPRKADEVTSWSEQAPEVPVEWFLHFSELHGVRHTQRVHIHAGRLAQLLGLDAPTSTKRELPPSPQGLRLQREALVKQLAAECQ